MKKNLIRTAAMGLGLAAIFATTSLNAASSFTERVTIPFEFRVAKANLPAGVYRVEQNLGTPMVMLVNVHTGQRVSLLRTSGDTKPGRTQLFFESTGAGHSLKRVS